MAPDHHHVWAEICMELAEQEFTVGRLATGAELAWGAAVHAVKYIAHQSPNLPTRSHDDVKSAVRQLGRQYPTMHLSSDFGHPEVLHRHFYRGNLQTHQVRNSWRRSQSLTANLLSLDANTIP